MVKLIDSFCRAVTALMAVALMIMVALVFGNVVLRYVFNSSITQSEEISRWLFVWITFMGCVVALREHTHLGTDALVSRLPPMGKKICLALGHVTMLYVCYLVFRGALEQARINMDVLAPSTQLPMAILHSAGVAFAACACIVLLLDLWLLFTGHMKDSDLVLIQESEDLAALNRPHGDDATRQH
ncbi:TRAP transporter small permease [Variovorax sp. J31P179]|uniref:TRAP transporter small permease n=1 Tax=Variovorax sp. J31P179 TaxID=3053508 RepID=UPI00257758C8|nr:TRAP transporter small permease [Variovorax sp. J31P179]MDM0083497.1 TRAP transporter small permease [Variovorax sp. J31P179]